MSNPAAVGKQFAASRLGNLCQKALVSERKATLLVPPHAGPFTPSRRVCEKGAPVADTPVEAFDFDQVVGSALDMGPRAGIGPVDSTISQAGANRIHQDIACRRIEMRLIHRKGGEPALPEATGPALSPVDDRRVASMGLPYSACEAPWFARYSDQVNVVGKKTVSPDRDRVPLALVGHELPVELVVESAEEGRLPPVSPLGDVVGYARNNPSRDSGHACKDVIQRSNLAHRPLWVLFPVPLSCPSMVSLYCVLAVKDAFFDSNLAPSVRRAAFSCPGCVSRLCVLLVCPVCVSRIPGSIGG